MNYLSVENISKYYGEKVLFEDITFGINKGQKIALIAKNGSGKTSLLDIVSGKDIPNSGNVIIRKNISVSYLSQKDRFDEELTVEQAIFTGNNPQIRAIKNYQIAVDNNHDVENYQKALEKMEELDAWNFESEYRQILNKLKIENLLNQRIKTLSGGQKKRLSLAFVLIENPDFLILDEPTNHLDLEMIEWLENYLKRDNLTLFTVTHDRYFLDRICNEIIELDEKKIYRYKGNYSYFLEKREERLQVEKSNIDRAKNIFRRELEWIRRQPKARTTKSKSRIEDFHIIKDSTLRRRKDHHIQLEINMERLGNKIIEIHNANKSYGSKKIISNFKYNFQRGERIGIIGENGVGKSTFLNIITKKEPLDSGKIIIGETVKIGYYTQEGIKIKENQKVIDVVKEYGEYIPLKKGLKISASQLLERFLFDSKKQYDYVEKLSGGELKRLFLCTILIKNPNFLIFDEPTNDLDIVTLNVLENFILDFSGNVLIVSHDRYFMDKIVDSLLIFKKDGDIQTFPGNYSDYIYYENSTLKESDSKKEDKQGKSFYNDQQKLKSLEKAIDKLQKEKQNIEHKLSESTLVGEDINKISSRIGEIIKEIEEKENLWLELSEKY